MNPSFQITIDGRPVPVTQGDTVLDAARRLGLDIPTLCYLERCGPQTSCLVCLVKVKQPGAARLVPSCALKVTPGLVIESETPEVHEARRTALELLFSDHVGDCLSPCQRICPLQLDIARMLRQIEAGQLTEAVATLLDAVPLPGVTGRLCNHPCENGCRRGTWDQPAAIRDLERMVADCDAQAPRPALPRQAASSGKSVVVLGAGPTGLAAAYYLRRQGHAVTLVDRHTSPGGSLWREVEQGTLPAEVMAWEIRRFRELGVQFKLGVELGQDLSIDGLLRGFDAVLLTIGESALNQAAGLGLAVASGGLRAEAETGLTPRSKVFAAGSAVKPVRTVVRALAEGRRVAAQLHRFLLGQPLQPEAKPFSSIMGRLAPAELERFLVGPNPASRVTTASELTPSYTLEEARAESGRCLHCDCRALAHCQLRHYADRYEADPNRFRTLRRSFEQTRQPGGILFEPGKCIRCGICVTLTEQAAEPLGLTFMGRGFNVQLGVPFDEALERGLQKVARECVQFCPTGALAFAEEAGIPSGCVTCVSG